MAKGAATSGTMGALHQKMAVILTRVLENYEKKLDEETLVDELLVEFEPSPAMMAVIAKFLKDNQIEFEAEEVNELGALEKRLAAKKTERPRFATITNLDVAGNG